MSEMSPGERALLRFRWFVYDAGSRPVVVAAVLAMLGAAAAIAAALLSVSPGLVGGFRRWVLFVSFGFRTDVQVGVLVAAVLLVIDALTGEAFRGQRALFWLLAIVAGVGVVANVAAIVASLTDVGVLTLTASTTVEAWTVVITTYLAPTALASVSAWIAVSGPRSFGHGRATLHDV